MNETLKKLGVFILFSVFTEILAHVYFYQGLNNMWISHLYAFIQVPLLSWIFLTIISSPVKKKIIVVVSAFYIFLSIINLAFWEDLIEFNSNQRYFAAVVIVMLCSMYFIQVFSEAKIMKIELEPNFWISSSILIYTTGTLFLFILKSQLVVEAGQDYWNLNCILNIILNLGLTASIWLGKTKSN